MPIQFFQQYQIKAEPPPSVAANAFFQAIESRWHQPWSEPVRFIINPRLKVVLSATGLIAPVLNPDTQITQFYESRWHYAWSEPVRFRRLATAHQQAEFGPRRLLPVPDVTAVISAIEDPDTGFFTVLVGGPEIPIDLTAVNVSVVEVESANVAASIGEGS